MNSPMNDAPLPRSAAVSIADLCAWTERCLSGADPKGLALRSCGSLNAANVASTASGTLLPDLSGRRYLEIVLQRVCVFNVLFVVLR